MHPLLQGHHEAETFCFVYVSRLFSVVPTGRMRGNGQKTTQITFHLNTKKKLFAVRDVKHRNRLFREVMESSSVETDKTCLDVVVDNMV